MLMIREFDPERIEKKNANYQKHYKTLIDPAGGCDSTIYRLPLKAVLKVLARDFPVSRDDHQIVGLEQPAADHGFPATG